MKRIITNKHFVSTYLLIFVFALMLGIVYFFDNPERISELEKKVFEEPLLKNFEVSKVKTINVFRPGGEKINLEKKDGRFVISELKDYPADNDEINQLLKELAAVTRANLASKEVSQQDYFDVTKEKALEIIILNDQKSEIGHLYLGKSREPVWNDQYLRLEGENMIYKVSTSIKNSFEKNAADFRDRRLLALNNFESANLKSFTWKVEGQKIKIIPEEASYKMLEPEVDEVEAQKFQSLLRSLSGLKAEQLLNEPKDAVGLKDGAEIIKIYMEMNDSSAIQISLGAKEDDPNYYYAEVSGNENIFKVLKSTVEFLKVNPKDILKRTDNDAAPTSSINTK